MRLIKKSHLNGLHQTSQAKSSEILSLRRGGVRLKSPDKIRVGALLSVYNEDDPRLGPGARTRLFDFDAAEFNQLRTFLKRMA